MLEFMFKLSVNEGVLDRIIRAFLGTALILIGLLLASGILKVILIALGVISVITAITGFCGLYALLRISTNKKKES